MTENEKKKADYTNSAENLCNPGEVMDLLVKLHSEESIKATFEDKLKEQCAELVDGIAKSLEVIAQIQKQIKEAVDQFGSYQDLETGEYAVKYRRMSKSYHVEPFLVKYSKYATAVVEQAINVKALEGLIKGGLLNEEDLKHPDIGVITETPTYAYYIR